MGNSSSSVGNTTTATISAALTVIILTLYPDSYKGN
jgi:hypothetical protein